MLSPTFHYIKTGLRPVPTKGISPWIPNLGLVVNQRLKDLTGDEYNHLMALLEQWQNTLNGEVLPEALKSKRDPGGSPREPLGEPKIDRRRGSRRHIPSAPLLHVL